MSTVFERVRELLIDELMVEEVDVVGSATIQGDLGADSLDKVSLVMALEEEFDVEIPDKDSDRMRTVGDVVNYLDARGAK